MTLPPKHVIAWIESASVEIKLKLQSAGFIELPEATTAEKVIDAYVELKRPDVKPKTLINYNDCKNHFLNYFGKDKIIQTITDTDIHDWKKWMLEKYAPITVHTTFVFIKAVFRYAIKKRWLVESPIEDVIVNVTVNRSRDRMIKRDEYDKMLLCCPSNQWRVVIALARIGGLRCPSEVMRLRWKDIDFESNILHVVSPKTERREGCGERTIPLFPALRAELERLYFDADYESRDKIITLSTSTKRIIDRITVKAGLGVIPRFFDMCRTSRSNEIERGYGSDYENAWIGHCNKTRRKYYWLPDEAILAKACSEQ
jgi:integrase